MILCSCTHCLPSAVDSFISSCLSPAQESPELQEAAAREAEEFFTAFGVRPEDQPGYEPPIDQRKCPCQSGLAYGECCLPYHAGQVCLCSPGAYPV